ncbi:sugar MFS transporter [Thalassotalea psychrophila]|uniref:Sugar MFS transporter n=1 Tax=Thalassotalea psychrophila TaxID=3065647 RepID=A0ABY9TQH7_9GAMM|nr:sugar MFS transporter [Colwelliaceae bacterium SQ149]
MTTATADTQSNTQSSFVPMMIIGILFFIFGFVTWLNGSLIPFLKIICELNEFQALFVTFAFYIAYTVMAYPMSTILSKTGYRNGMAFGLAIMVVGALLFIPAATTANYVFFLVALFTLGTGLTILQTASNPYLVHVGPKETAAVRISVMGIINKSAGVLVPILFTALVLSGMGDFSEDALASLDAATRAAKIEELSSQLIMPYVYMAIVLTGLIALVKFSNLPELHIEEEESDVENTTGILNFPQAILGAIALFAYVGVEVIAADTIGLYGSGVGVEHFASLTSYTMVGMVIGYIIGIIAIPKYANQKTALIVCSVAGALCILGVVMSSTTSTSIADVLWGWSGIPVIPDSLTFVALMGLSHAMVWPLIWPLALDGLGKYTAQGSALLIMGIAGGALLPLLFGKIAQLNGDTQVAYWIGLPCYLFILFYAVKGHKMRSWS